MMRDSIESHPARVTVDAGGETWATLAAMIGRRVGELTSGDILHVISLEATMGNDISHWCATTGHELLVVQPDEDATHFWIRKR